MVLVGSTNRDHRILHHIAGRDAVVPPHLELYRKLPRRPSIELVTVRESYKPVQITFLDGGPGARLQCSVDRKAAATRNRLLVRRQPNQTGMIAVVVDLEVNGISAHLWPA